MPDKYKVMHKIIILLIFVLGFSLRLIFAPVENLSADPFEVLTSAKTLAETGQYLVPSVGSADLKIRYISPPWPVGFPLMLSIIFKFVGYSEFIARLFTIFLASLSIVFVILIANLFFPKKEAYFSGIIMAINPLLVAFNSRIFTTNPAVLFLIASIAFLLLSVIDRDKELRFVDPSLILSKKSRLLSFLMAFLSLGYLLTIRDTAVMFLLVHLYVFSKASFFKLNFVRERLKVIAKLFLMAVIAFMLAFLPSVYYN